MATHDYNLANQSGADFRADLNNALSAILSNNASATEPTTTTAYMLWVDTTNNLLKMRNSADNAWITLPVSITTSNTVDIDGGTVNTITSLSFSSGETVTTILDEDDLSSDSASALATQQSIKAYVDSQVTAQDLDFQGDTGGALSIDLDSETFTITGGNGIDTSGALNTLTIAIDSSVVTLTDTQTLTNKTIDADNNTVSNLEVDSLKSGVLDTDLTSVSASDDTLASSKAIKTYVDAQVTAQDLDLTDGTTSISIDLDSEELSVLGGTGVTSTASGNGVTLAIGQDVGTTADVIFNTVSADLTGDVTGTVSSLANHDTDDLAEGTNLYYTQARFDSALAAKDTGDLTEGTNLYYTTARFDSAFSGKSTSDLTEGTNLYYTASRFDSAFSGKSTSDLTEGTNLYYTDARFDTRLATKDTDDLTEGASNLYFTTARIDGHLSGGTGVTYSSGTISIGQAVSTTSDVTFNDVIVSGDLTVSGTTTTVNTETINLADNIILFNSNATGTPSENAGIEIERGDATNKTLLWNEADDKWTVGSETFVAATFEGALTGNVTGTVSSLSNHDTGDLAEGSNLYYTTARFDSAFSGKTTSDLTEGTNLYYTTARFDTAFSGKDTDDLTEGATNLYYTTARANSDFDTRLATKSTSDLSEGTNLYYTTARFDSAFGGKSTSDLSEGTNLYFTDERVDDRVSNLLVAGSNVTLTYDDVANTLTIAATEDNLSNNDTDDLAEGSTNLYYTDARARAAISASGDLSYNSTTGVMSFTERTDAEVRGLISGGTGVTYNSSTGEISIGQSVGTGDSVTFAGVSSDFTGDIDGAVKFTGKADVALTKGQVVYISGISGDVPTVNLADADNSSAMPAFGLVYANANQNAEVEIITFGSLSGFDTSGFSVGDTVYVSTTAGSLTATPPTGESSLIQNIGIVQRSHASAGIIKVGGAGRTNATPNLNSGKIFYGNGSNQSVATTLDTSIVPENTNLYYTDSRFDTRLASKSTSDLSEGTNLYYTTARFDSAFSGKDTDNLSEGSSNLYYTDERVDDRVSNLLVAGSNVTLTYNDVANTLTISATEDNLSNNDTDDLAEGATNLYFTNERVDDRVAALIQDGTGISWSYVDASGTLTPTVSLSSFSTTNLSEGTNLYYTTARFDSAFSGKSTSDLSEGTNLYYTDERVDDRVANLLTAGSNITLTYDDGAGTLTIAATEDNLSNNDTDDLAEGSTNLYFTTARARSSISATGDISYNSTTGVISFTASSAVTSVNSQTGTVVLDTDDISEGVTNLYFTDERVDDRVSNLLTAGTGITLTYNDVANTLTIAGSAQYGDSDVESYLDTNGLTLPDNVKAQFGASNDLQIFHDGTHSFIQDTGTGDLIIYGTGEDLAKFKDDGAVELYYDGSLKIATTSTGIDVTGNITVSGTVDGRDLATDGTKLDGIESGATADQTASEILTLIKTVDGAGSGLDADTLDGVSSASFLRSDADDTLSGNLTVTGNLTVQGTTVTLDATTLNVEDKNITLNYSTGDSSGSADGAGITIQDAVNSTTDATILWDATNDEFDFSHAINVTGNISTSGTVDGRDIASDGSKLDGIESGATADQTAAEILTAIKTVDGAGSGLDADLLDGLSSASFVRSDASDSISGALSISQGTSATPSLSVTNSGGTGSSVIAKFIGDSDGIEIINSGVGDYQIRNTQQNNGITLYDGTGGVALLYNGTLTAGVDSGGGFSVYTGGLTVDSGNINIVSGNLTLSGTVDGRDIASDGSKLDGIESGATADQTAAEILTAIKTVDGAGSGLDADLLDGQSSAYYATASSLSSYLPLSGGTITGNVTMTGADAENALTLSGTRPTIAFTDTDSGADDFYIHVNSNNFYILTDRGGVGGYNAWETPHPLLLEADTNIGYLFDSRIFADNYHPNADKWTTARTITLGGDLTGNVSIDGSANVTLTAAVVDDSHNHVISNVDGLQTALDAKLDSSSYTAADVLTKIKTVDGAGSGLDADLLDGIGSGSFLRSDAGDSWNIGRGVVYVENNSGDNNSGAGITLRTSSNPSSGDPASVGNIFAIRSSGQALRFAVGQSITSTGDNDFTTNDLTANGNITVTGTVDGRDVASDGSKLDGIESGATADQSASEILTLIKTVDGAGSGLDADLLDGISSASFLRSDASDTFTTLSGTQLNLGSQVQLKESSERGDLLEISSVTTGWAGLQIRNTSNEGRWSFMTDGSVAGIYDDENNDWHIYMTENAGVQLRYNGSTKFATTTSGIEVTGSVITSSTAGINQPSPSQQLVVRDATNYEGILVHGSNAPNICFDRGDTQVSEWKVGISGNNGESFAISKGTANDDKLRIDSGGVTNLIGGLRFGVDTAAANTLDDYEEGTWTPVNNGGTTGGATNLTGRYTKIGRIVYAHMSFNTSGGVDTGLNYRVISGLPYAMYANSPVGHLGTCSMYNLDAYRSGYVLNNSSGNNTEMFMAWNQTTSTGSLFRALLVYETA